jgi:hypothetical protein
MIKLIPAGLLMLLVVTAVSLGFFVPRLEDSAQSVNEKEVWFFTNHQISQTVIPRNNGLSMIRIFMRNVALRNNDPVNFSLSDNNGKIIRQITFNGFNVGDGETIRLQFDPIADSSGNTYRFTFTSPTKEVGQALGIGFTSQNLYPGGKAEINENADGDLTFQLYYQPTNRASAVLAVFINFLCNLITLRIIVTLVCSFIFLVSLLGLINPSRLFSPRHIPGDR